MKYVKLFEDYANLSSRHWEGNKLIVTGAYSPKPGDYDGMHSFQSRRKDKFGGYMNTAVEEALLEFYKQRKNPMIEKIDIVMDDSAWKVNWRVTISESLDGKAWMGLTSRGGAGRKDGPFGTIKRAESQIKKKINDLPRELGDSSIEIKQIKNIKGTTTLPDALDWQGKNAHIHQIFVSYTNPKKYPPVSKETDSGFIV
jgi:hypothetical protein